MMDQSKAEYIATIDEIEYYCFSPSLFRHYLDCYKKGEAPQYEGTPVHQIRMAIEHIRGKYRVYYMQKDGEVLGHLVVSRGGGRLRLSSPSDIVIGPIWIAPSRRGQGLGTKGINAVLHSLGIAYENAYEFIEKSNAASIKTVEKNHFEFVARAGAVGVLRNIRQDENGCFIIYRYSEQNR